MNRALQPGQFFPVADGTRVALVLNPWEVNARAPSFHTYAGASIAVGELPPGCVSHPHLHPIVSQVTWVLDGRLRARMKGPADAAAYELDVGPDQAVLTAPMTFLQLINLDAVQTTRVLYVVSPAYVYLPGEDGYDDAVVFRESWDMLAQNGFSTAQIADLRTIGARRALAQQRLRAARS